MNTDPELSTLLHSWRVRPPPAPGFADGVRDRLRAQPEPAVVSWWVRNARLAAALALTGAGVVGGAGGLFVEREVRNREALAAYVRSIDPVQLSQDGHVHR
jgi:hypothetical protein